MKLDLSKLQNVKHLSGGKTTAQCPACAADGGDVKKEHLAVFADGKFGCVVHPKDKEHNKLILQLAGSRSAGAAHCRLTVKPVRVEDSKVLMKVGRLGRVKPTPELPDDRSCPQNAGSSVSQPHADSPLKREELEPVPVDNIALDLSLSEDITDEVLREFLDLPAVVA